VVRDGRPVAFLERGARTLFTFASGDGPAGDDTSWIDAVVGLVKDGRLRRIELTRIDGSPVADAPMADAFRERGFVDGYRGLSFRG
jgi:ATP-dependent Lhr-like helicase